MGTQKLIFLRTHLYFLAQGFFIHFLCGYMLQILCSFWALLCSCFFFAVGSTRRLSRAHAVEGPQQKEEKPDFYALNEEKQLNSDDSRESRADGEDSVLLEATAASKYEFLSGIDITRFVDEPETVMMSFVVEEYCLGFMEMDHDAVISEAADVDGKIQSFGENSANILNSGDEAVPEEQQELIEPLLGEIDSEVDSVSSNFKFGFFTNGFLLGDVEKPRSFSDDVVFEEAGVAERRDLHVERSIGDENDSENKLHLKEENFLGQDQILTSVSNVESVNLDFKPDYLSEEGDLLSIHEVESVEGIQESPATEANILNFAENAEETEAALFPDETELSDDEFIEMKLEDTNYSKPFDDSYDESREFMVEEEEEEDPTFDDEDDSEFWEHDDIVDQLKLELRNARTGGLPTIVEETESESESSSPIAMVTNLKPLNTIIEPKLEHKDRIMEIMKVYRSYAEKMRKLDVLNYQTMHAIGLLHLKDPHTSHESQKNFIPPLKSLLLQNLAPQKIRKNKIGPTVRSMESFYADLETVCVGHVCLSWEILQWQYGKTRELLEFDSSNHRQYNHVANELQLFQVLLQRFVEDEPFQNGPRIENYVKNRCVLRSLLQIPAVRDDSFIDKKRKAGAENAVTAAHLLEILEESIRVLWDFVRSDKDEPNSIQKLSKKPQIGLLDSDSDLNLLMDVKDHLHKKERYLKDIVRSGNCIVKRFQKHHGRVDKTVLFTQIEMKMISRVLNMRKLTRDQLAWCHEKLDRTSIVSRKIFVEPSFLLFPC